TTISLNDSRPLRPEPLAAERSQIPTFSAPFATSVQRHGECFSVTDPRIPRPMMHAVATRWGKLLLGGLFGILALGAAVVGVVLLDQHKQAHADAGVAK